MTLKYRPEVDGLRAVAVTPVVLYHAGITVVSGGFVGVDVFFVISGYLITLLLLGDLASDRFSIIHFYERRARRILPALSAVMLLILPLAYFSLMPNGVKDFSEGLIFVSLFSSNFLFWHQAGYFDVASELKPLIHTWSLAVEEQYYLLFPLALALMWRFARRWILAIFLLLAGLSFGLSQWGVWMHPSAAFYWLPMRGWELLVGAMVAADEFKAGRREFKNSIGSFGALIGLLLIAFAAFRFNDETPFPGVNALLPTIGAAMVILFAGRNNLIGKLLGSRPLVGVGLISYSLYLWHQPLLALARNRSLRDLSRTETWAIIAVSILLSYFTWRYIERPFRDRTRVTRAQVFRFAAISCALFLFIGAIGIGTQGALWNSKNLATIQTLDDRLSINTGLNAACENRFTDVPQCRTSDDPEVLLWGDSFAMHLMDGLVASNPGIKIRQATVSQCGPVFDIAPNLYGAKWTRDCLATNDSVRNLLRSSRTIRYVVLSSPFSQYLSNGALVMNRNGTEEKGDAVFSSYFEKTLVEIRKDGMVPIIFSPTPRSGFNNGRCLEKAVYFKEDIHKCDFSLQEANQRQLPVIEALNRISGIARVIWLSNEMCTGDECRSSENGTFIYRDSNHLSHEGSELLGRRMNWYSVISSSN
jgi:peptidoglycan/LPS O-acetylase OafA/YrhL